ncbi:cytochrome c3 family protein [Spongiivirga citrea]|uniref:Cytochrome C n=1 Tax=Spongiivirga citrea TaxID=1481457 RepID=A0A6M0CIW9_9FLAO|nr:cytochrome c3 family protein [Spongiivirga citrea]NER17472.1 cytochrome C [Spongiivirga citrea]
MNNSTKIYLLLFLVSLTIISCKKKDEYHSLDERIHAETRTGANGGVNSEILLSDKNLMEITEGHHTFLIPERKGELTSYSCTECHNKPLKQIASSDIKKAHWNIKINHAGSEVMNCATCHNGNDMNNLVSLTGKKIDFNKSYKQCAQCHTVQFEDWKGGAHGKKLAGWAPPRASMTCVNCHNPHEPSFDQRWPVRFNSEKVQERKDGFEFK